MSNLKYENSLVWKVVKQSLAIPKKLYRYTKIQQGHKRMADGGSEPGFLLQRKLQICNGEI